MVDLHVPPMTQSKRTLWGEGKKTQKKEDKCEDRARLLFR